jgi:hypothetical protein
LLAGIAAAAVVISLACGAGDEPSGQVDASTGQVHASSGQVHASSGQADASSGQVHASTASSAIAFLDTLEERTFNYFWQLSSPRTGLTPDRAPTRSFASVAATGFALTAYPVGAERGYVSREEARRRVLDTLRFLWTAPQDTAASGASGYRGFFYHFLEPETGHRFAEVELSTMDTALLLAGVLFCQSYFDRPADEEAAIRRYADSLYTRVDWQWASVRPPAIGHGWKPESGFLPYDWRGYNEAMLLYLLALGSPSHPVAPEAWSAWLAGYRWGEFHGQEHLGFAPLFGHQYTHVWIDLRGIRDSFGREQEIDYFENSRRAVYAQQAYAIANPMAWSGYGPRFWGLTACDGPLHGRFEIGGEERQFHTYWARGASFNGVMDDGTVSPTAAGGSIAFAPEIVIPTLVSMRRTYGERLFSTYGFLDAVNPSFKFDVEVQHGRVDPEHGWFDTDYLGIDQGPILAMTENYRSELVWRTMRKNPHVVRGLRAAGFTGGWLDEGSR